MRITPGGSYNPLYGAPLSVHSNVWKVRGESNMHGGYEVGQKVRERRAGRENVDAGGKDSG